MAGKVGGVRLAFHYHFFVAVAWQKRENSTPPEIGTTPPGRLVFAIYTPRKYAALLGVVVKWAGWTMH